MRTSDATEVWVVVRTVTDEELAALVQRITEAAQALISGDIAGYAARIKHAADYTLMSPYGRPGARIRRLRPGVGCSCAVLSRRPVEGRGRGDLRLRRLGGARRHRATARDDRGSPGAGLVAAGDVGLPAHC